MIIQQEKLEIIQFRVYYEITRRKSGYHYWCQPWNRKRSCRSFAQHGANIAFTYSSSVESALALENELNAMGIKAKGYQSNAADFNEAQIFVDAVIEEFGTVDILINNAGITKDNLLMRMSEADYDQVIDVNLKSVFNMTKAIQKHF